MNNATVFLGKERSSQRWIAAKRLSLCKWRIIWVYNYRRLFLEVESFKRLAQGLNPSPTAFSCCVNNYIQSCLASDKCFVYFDNLGSGAEDGYTFIRNLEFFRWIQNLDFKLSNEKCPFGLPKIQFLGHEISADGISPSKTKVEKFLAILRMPKTREQVCRLIGFIQYFHKNVYRILHLNCTLSLNYYKKIQLALRTTISGYSQKWFN